MRSPGPRVVAALAAAVLVVLSAAEAAAGTLRVPQQFGTIQEAVDAAQDGDTIRVSKGAYAEAVTLTGLTGIRLLAAGKVTIDAGESGRPLTVSGCTDALVSGFTFTGGTDHGVLLAGSAGGRLSRCSVRDVPIRGVMLDGCSGVRVERLAVERTGEDGISTSGSDGGPTDDTTVIGCRVRTCGRDGIHLDGSRNRVASCLVQDVVREGARIGSGSGTVVERSRIERCGSMGVEIQDSHASGVVRSNRVSGCDDYAVGQFGGEGTVAGNRLADAYQGVFVGGDGCTVSKNRVDRAETEGIQVNGTGAFVEKNRVEKAGKNGIQVIGDGNRFEKNVVRRAGRYGFSVDAAMNTFVRNQATRSGEQDLYDDSGSGTNVYEKNRFPKQVIVGGGP